MSEVVRTGVAPTALGKLFVAATDAGLCVVSFDPVRGRRVFGSWLERHAPRARVVTAGRALAPTIEQLTEYADGTRRHFDLDLDLRGTPFQLAVWAAMSRIPFGHSATYGQLAERVGRPGASRAVGLACGANPVPIVVPCHRVLARGGLGGFSAGIDRKRRLLAHEGLHLPLPTG